MPTQDAETTRQQVRDGYAAIAVGQRQSCCGASSCCSGDTGELATQIGYAADDLADLPDGANLGLSCGNPTALASLKAGEVVLDLGSGGGFDCFIAGPKVGPTGHVIGVDMTAEMLAKARANFVAYNARTGLGNVEFRLGEIEHLPVADNSVDVVISNCVINLSPDKLQVWQEITRVLKPGGRVAVSDMALLRPLPPAVAEMVAALVGCVAGAIQVEDTRRYMAVAGLTDITLTPKAGYVDALVAGNDPLYADISAALPPNTKASDYVTSLDIAARKPA